MNDNLFYVEQMVINSSTDMQTVLDNSPVVGATYKVTSAFDYNYGDIEHPDIVSYSAPQLVMYDGSKLMPFYMLSERELQILYKRFQTWSLEWFLETAQSAQIYFESFFARGTNNINANEVKNNAVFSLTKDNGDLDMDLTGTVTLKSFYSQFKVNLEVNFPTPNSNNNYLQFTVIAKCKKGSGAYTDIIQVATLDTTIPTHHITFNYDLYDKDTIQFRFSTNEGVATAWNFNSNVSILGYLIGHDNNSGT